MQAFYLAVFLASLYGLMLFVKNGLRLSISHAQIPFVTVMLLGSVLYAAALFGLILQASWFVFLTGLAYLAKSLMHRYSAFRRGHLSSPPNIHPGRRLFPLTLFGILYFLNWFIFRDGMFSQWDEWFTWGLHTKVLTSYDHLSTRQYDITHSHYPRITSILQYYFILFLNNGKFHEGTTIFAQTVVFSSAVPAFLCFIKHRTLFLDLSVSASFVLAFYCIIHLFANYIHVYSIYADSVLGLCWGMSVILYISNRSSVESMIIAGIALFFLVQIKVTGVFFAFCTLLVITIDRMFFHSYALPIKLKQIGTLLAVVVVSYASWNMFKTVYEIESMHHANLRTSAVNIIRDILLDPEDYQKATAVNWLRSMTYAGNLDKIRAELHETEDDFVAGFGPTLRFFGPLSLSPLYWMIISAIFISSLYCVQARGAVHIYGLRNVYLTTMICLAVLVVIYSCLILFLFMSYFSQWEAVRLASFGRYIGTAFLGMFLVLFYFILTTENKVLIIAFITLIYLFTPTTMLGYFLPKSQSDYGYINGIYERIDPVIREIENEDPESKILFINQGGNGQTYHISKYRVFPIANYFSITKHYYSVSTRKRDDWEPWVRVFSPEEFSKILQTMDYMIVWNDTEFFEMYGDVVERSKLKAIWKPAADGRLEKYVFP